MRCVGGPPRAAGRGAGWWWGAVRKGKGNGERGKGGEEGATPQVKQKANIKNLYIKKNSNFLF